MHSYSGFGLLHSKVCTLTTHGLGDWSEKGTWRCRSVARVDTKIPQSLPPSSIQQRRATSWQRHCRTGNSSRWYQLLCLCQWHTNLDVLTCLLLSIHSFIYFFPLSSISIGHPQLEFTIENSGWLILSFPASYADIARRHSISLGQSSWLFPYNSFFLLTHVLYQICNISSGGQPARFFCVQIQISFGPSLAWPASSSRQISSNTLHHTMLTPNKRSCQGPLSEHLIKSLPSSYPSTNSSHLTSYLMKKSSCLPLCSKNYIALSPLHATPAESILPPHPLASSTVAPLMPACWLLASLLSCRPCFFWRAARSHPRIACYLYSIFWKYNM